MGAMIASAPKANGFVFANSTDGDCDRNLREAIEASNEDYAFRTQLEETLNFSTITYAYDLQVADIAAASSVPNPSSSKDGPSSPHSKAEASSSHSKDEPFSSEYVPVNYYEQGNGLDFQGCGGGKVGDSRGKEVDTGLECPQCPVQKTVPLELCGICYEGSAAEMFEGIRCLDRFCHPCMTKYIYTRLKQRRRQIYCPNELCGELLTPQECRYFLPVEIIDAWSGVVSGVQSPEVEKVHCPFLDCSAVLVKEEIAGLSAMDIMDAECPFCNRMFCVRCMAPWHADRDCKFKT